MQISNMTSKGQVTIPAELRRDLGLKPGDKVRFIKRGSKVSIEAVVEPPIDSIFGLLKAPRDRGISDVDAALAALATGSSKADSK